ncbi:hypothetical protein YO5_00755 [Stutzerimonas stutzeri TS44]|nr:hypothetical protein YO5_00755 [Stutzerimonas stutzeri TS44]
MEGRQLFGIEQLSRLRVIAVKVTSLAPALPDRITGTLEHLLVIGVLPLDQLANNVEQLLALEFRFLLVHPIAQLTLVARVVNHLGKDHRPRRGQRSPRPPQMQRTRMALTDSLFTGCGDVDVVQRQRDFDEFFWGFDRMHY